MTQIIKQKRRRFIGGFEPEEIGKAQTNSHDLCVFDLSGSGEYFSNDTLNTYGPGNTVSISCWLKIDASVDADVIWDFNGDASTTDRNRWYLQMSHTFQLWVFRCVDADGNMTQCTATGFNVVGNHHIVCVKDGTDSMTVYVDGVAMNQVTASVPQTDDVTRISCVGAEAVGKGHQSGMRIHSLAMWDVALTAEEVAAIWCNGLGSMVDLKHRLDYGPGCTYTSASNLLHWWRFGFDWNNIGEDYGYADTLIDMVATGLTIADVSQQDMSGAAMDCNGTTEWLANTSLNDYGAGSSFTVAVWGIVDIYHGTADMFLDLDTGVGNNDRIALWTFLGKYIFGVWDSGGNGTGLGGPVVKSNATVLHMVGVKDGTSSMKLYINGELVNTETASIITTQEVPRRGAIWSDHASAMSTDGRPFSAAIWDKVLSDEEVKAIYNSGHMTVDLSKRWGEYKSYGNLQHWWWTAQSHGKAYGETTDKEFGYDMVPSNKINMQINASNLTHIGDKRILPLGPQGVCVEMDGSTEYLANTTDQPIGIANSWSISQWVYIKELAHDQCLIEFSRAATDSDEITIRHMGTIAGDPYKVELVGGVKTWHWNALIPANGRWYHIVTIWDGTDIKVYRNGVEIAVSTKILDGAVTQADGNRSTYIGYSDDNSGEYLNGRIGHTAVWNSVLSADEIAQIYVGQFTMDLENDYGSYVSSANLQHWWKIGEDHEDIGKDSGGADTLIDIDENSANITYAQNIIGENPRHGTN